MKNLCILFMLVLGFHTVVAQEAHREELYNTGNVRLNAYHFPATGEHLFILHGNYTTNIDLGDGSFDTVVEVFSGNAVEAKSFFNEWYGFAKGNSHNFGTAVRVGDILIQRGKFIFGSCNELILPRGQVVQLLDKDFWKLYEEFQRYCAVNGL